MFKKQKENKRNQALTMQKGITLIALVITVVVLIILAGITINMVLGENGIATRAAQAREDNERAEYYEEISLAFHEEQIEERIANIGKVMPSIEEGNKVAATKLSYTEFFKVASINGNENKEGTFLRRVADALQNKSKYPKCAENTNIDNTVEGQITITTTDKYEFVYVVTVDGIENKGKAADLHVHEWERRVSSTGNTQHTVTYVCKGCGATDESRTVTEAHDLVVGDWESASSSEHSRRIYCADSCGYDNTEYGNHTTSNPGDICSFCGYMSQLEECTYHIDWDGDHVCEKCGNYSVTIGSYAGDWERTTSVCTYHYDEDGDGICEDCGYDVKKFICTSHVDGGYGYCKNCKYAVVESCSNHYDKGDGTCASCGNSVRANEDRCPHNQGKGGGAYCKMCEIDYITNENMGADGRYCEQCVSGHADVNGDKTCDYCNQQFIFCKNGVWHFFESGGDCAWCGRSKDGSKEEACSTCEGSRQITLS